MLRKRSASLVLSACAAATVPSFAATITNPSFETETFTVWPGYISGNGPITGWTPSGTGNTTDATARTGQNSNPPTWVPANTSPFGNNGIYPDGTRVGFIQAVSTAATPATTTLSNTITGLTAGQTYRVTFNFNSRNNGNAANQRPNATATAGNYTVNFQAAPVEAANSFTQPFRTGSLVFTATGPTANLALTNAAPSGTAVDSTLVIDNFQVTQAAPTRWSSSAWTNDATSGIDPATRSYTHAYNLGSANNANINGVNFVGVATANPAVAGSFSTTGWTNPLADPSNNVMAAGGGSGTLASTFVYGGASQTAQSLTLEGLTPGTPYHLTLFGVGWSDAGSIARAATYSGGNGDTLTMDEHQFGVDNGIRFDFDYTATGSTQIFTLNPTASVTTTHLYGFANAAVPEPSTLAALAAGGLALSARRHRRRQ